jgi:hypothetical protein
MNTIGRLVIANLLAISFLIDAWAADPWVTTSHEQWSERDVKKILEDSSWSQQIVVSMRQLVAAGFNFVPDVKDSTGGAGHRPFGGGEGGMSPSGSGAARNGEGRGVGGGPPAGGRPSYSGRSTEELGELPPAIFLLSWESSLLVRRAKARRTQLYGGEKEDDSIQKYINQSFDHYVLVLNLPEAVAAQLPPDLGKIEAETRLLVDSREHIPVLSVSVQNSERNIVYFRFPHVKPNGEPTIGPSSKDLEFSTNYAGIKIKKKFSLPKMKVAGKLDI